MVFRTAFAVLALTLAPTFALAEGCMHDKLTQTSSQCGTGQIWDAATQACITPVSS